MTSNKRNPDYSATAVNLTNPDEIATALGELHAEQAKAVRYEQALETVPLYADLQACQLAIASLTTRIKVLIDEKGSYQDLEKGEYAVKYARKSKSYYALPFRTHFEKFAPAVIIETIDSKALEGLVKGGLISEIELKQTGVLTETVNYAFIIK